MNKKLLILSVPPPFGGGEIRAKELSNYFSSHSDFVVVENSNKKSSKANQGRILFSNLMNNTKYIFLNVWSILKEKPSLVYMSIPKGFIPLLKVLPVLFVSKLMRISVVGELAGRNFYFLERRGISYQIGLKILKCFDSIRVLGKSVDEVLKSHGLFANVIIDNGVKIPSQIDNKIKELDESFLTIGFVGALHKNKGIFILLEVANLLKLSKVNFTMEIAGEWQNLQDKLEAEIFIRKCGLTEHVKFLGLIHNYEKWQFYKRIDIFILPSYNEGQPMVLIEAMAFGIPVICSNVGAIPDTIISGFNGFIIEEFLADRYMDGINKLVTNQKYYSEISKNNLDIFSSRFQIDSYLTNIHSWLSSIPK